MVRSITNHCTEASIVPVHKSYKVSPRYLKKNLNAPRPSEHPPVSPRYYYTVDPMSLPSGNPFKAIIKRVLKKNQNAPRPSEHPPVIRGEKMSKRLGGIKGCKYKTSSWHLNRFPDAKNIGSTL